MKKDGIEYVNATMADVKGLVELEKEVWGGMAAEDSKWISRIKIYPAGTFVAKQNGKILGVVVTCRINWPYADNEHPTWDEASGNGFLTNHRDDGEVSFGVDLTVNDSPGVAVELLKLAIDLHWANKARRGMLGGRFPSLAEYVKNNNIDSETLTPEKVLALSREDSQVKFFCAQGLTPIAAKKNYFPPDKDSLGWGIILEAIK